MTKDYDLAVYHHWYREYHLLYEHRYLLRERTSGTTARLLKLDQELWAPRYEILERPRCQRDDCWTESLPLRGIRAYA